MKKIISGFFAWGIILALSHGVAKAGVLPEECAIYQPAQDSKIFYVELQSGGMISNMSVAGQEKATMSTRVVIPEEEGKLYLVLASNEPIIWEMTGDTKRVSDIVVAGPETAGQGKVAGGVTGFAADHVSFVPKQKCISSMHRVFKEVSPARAPRHIVGREADVSGVWQSAIEVHASLKGIRFDSPPKELSPAPQGVDERLWESFQKYYPGGTASLQQKDVVASSPAEQYKVMPGWAGLIQLVTSGGLAAHYTERQGHTIQLSDGKSTPAADLSFEIVQDIGWFPSGLFGGLAVPFILKKGVSFPKGDPGHGCVISGETKMPLANEANCKARYRFLME